MEPPDFNHTLMSCLQYHHRLYTLDSQVKQGDEANLFKLAEWNQRRTLFSKKKRVEAERQLKKSSHSKEFLKAQWKEQVKAQTKPAPRRSSALDPGIK